MTKMKILRPKNLYEIKFILGYDFFMLAQD